MKWHIICLVTISLLAVNPIEFVNEWATDCDPSEAQLAIISVTVAQPGARCFLMREN